MGEHDQWLTFSQQTSARSTYIFAHLVRIGSDVTNALVPKHTAKCTVSILKRLEVGIFEWDYEHRLHGIQGLRIYLGAKVKWPSAS